MKGDKMYYRKGRLSFYLAQDLFWLRVRDSQMQPSGFLLRMGRESQSEDSTFQELLDQD